MDKIYLVNETDLTAIADAIREKTGTTEPLTLEEMEIAVTDITTGGGDTETEDGLITREILECRNSRVSTVASCAFMYCDSLTTVDLPNVTTVSPSAFTQCKALETVNLPEVTTIAQSAFAACSKLTSITLPKCKSILNNAFVSCSSLKTFEAPLLQNISAAAFMSCSKLTSVSFPDCTIVASSAFYACSSLTAVTLPVCKTINPSTFRNCISLTSVGIPVCSQIGAAAFQSCKLLPVLDAPLLKISSNAFSGCSKLSALILRASSCATLSNVNAFNGTPMSVSTYIGKFGSIYVPLSLVDTYKAATNWVTFSNRITAIEGSEFE